MGEPLPLNPGESLQEIQRELSETFPDHFGLLRLELPTGQDDDARRIHAVDAWVARHGYSSRDRPNPWRWLSPEGALGWLDHRLTRGLAYNYELMNRWHARRLAQSLLRVLPSARYATSDFVIEDWTFNDILVIATDEEAIVLAILGED